HDPARDDRHRFRAHAPASRHGRDDARRPHRDVRVARPPSRRAHHDVAFAKRLVTLGEWGVGGGGWELSTSNRARGFISHSPPLPPTPKTYFPYKPTSFACATTCPLIAFSKSS